MAKKPPEIGEVVNGWTYTGGNPRDPKSWTRRKVLDIPPAILAQEMESYQMKPFQPPPPSGLARFGRGFADLSQGATQLGLRALGALPDVMAGDWSEDIAAYEKEKNAELAMYEKGRDPEGKGGMDWMRLGGNVAGTIPLGVAFAPATAGGAAGLGALSAGMMYSPTETDFGFFLNKALQTGAGALGGYGGFKLSNFIGRHAPHLMKEFRRMPDKARQQLEASIRNAIEQEGVDPGQMSDDAINRIINQVSSRIDDYGDMSPDEMLRMSRFERLGYTGNQAPTRSMVTRNPADWTDESNAARMIGMDRPNPIVDRRELISQRSMDLLDDVGRIGQPGNDVIPSVQAAATRSQQAVSNLYRAAEQAPGSSRIIENLDQFADDLINAYATFADEIPSGPRNMLLQFTDGRLTPTVDNVSRFWRTINAQGMPGGTQGASLNALRYAARGAIDRTARAGGENARELRTAALAAARRFGWIRGENNAPTRLVRSIVDGNVDSGKFMTQITSKGFDELDHLRRYLLNFAPEHGVDGQRAWDQIRRSVADRLVRSATGGMDERSWINLNANSFTREWRKLNERGLATLFFNPDEYQLIDDMSRAFLDITRTPRGAAPNFSNTAPTMAKIASMMQRIPILRGVANLVAGGLNLGDEYVQRSAAMQTAQEALKPMGGPRGQQEMMAYLRQFFPTTGAVTAEEVRR